MLPFSGLSVFPLTPTDTDGHVNYDDLAVLLSRIVFSHPSIIRH